MCPEQIIGGSRGCAWCTPSPPPRVQILSFQHTKFSKHNCLGSQRSSLRSRRPPTGNPGSATANIRRKGSNELSELELSWTDCTYFCLDAISLGPNSKKRIKTMYIAIIINRIRLNDIRTMVNDVAQKIYMVDVQLYWFTYWQCGKVGHVSNKK